MPVIMIAHKYYQDKVFYYLLQPLATKLCSNTQGKSVSWHLGRVYSRKKCHIKFTLSRQMGRKRRTQG